MLNNGRFSGTCWTDSYHKNIDPQECVIIYAEGMQLRHGHCTSRAIIFVNSSIDEKYESYIRQSYTNIPGPGRLS